MKALLLGILFGVGILANAMVSALVGYTYGGIVWVIRNYKESKIPRF